MLKREVLRYIKIIGLVYPKELVVNSGRARGVDSLGERWASEYSVDVEYFVPDWKGLGKRAGFVRNISMADRSTHVIAFWNGKSRGTRHMIDYAKLKGKYDHVVHYN